MEKTERADFATVAWLRRLKTTSTNSKCLILMICASSIGAIHQSFNIHFLLVPIQHMEIHFNTGTI